MSGLWPASNFEARSLQYWRSRASHSSTPQSASPSARDPFGIGEGFQPATPFGPPSGPGAYQASSSVGNISFPRKWRESRNARRSRSLESFGPQLGDPKRKTTGFKAGGTPLRLGDERGHQIPGQSQQIPPGPFGGILRVVERDPFVVLDHAQFLHLAKRGAPFAHLRQRHRKLLARHVQI